MSSPELILRKQKRPYFDNMGPNLTDTYFNNKRSKDAALCYFEHMTYKLSESNNRAKHKIS